MFGIVDDAVQLVPARSIRGCTSATPSRRRSTTWGAPAATAGWPGEVPLGIFADCDLSDATFLDIVERLVTRQLYAALGLDAEPDAE